MVLVSRLDAGAGISVEEAAKSVYSVGVPWGADGPVDAFLRSLGDLAAGWVLASVRMDRDLKAAGVRMARRWADIPNDFCAFERAHGGKATEDLVAMEAGFLTGMERCLFCTPEDLASTAGRHPGMSAAAWEVVPNGISADECAAVVPSSAAASRSRLGIGQPVVLFAGSNFGPNNEAVDDILSHYAPAFPHVVFVVLGLRLDRYLRGGGHPPEPNTVFTGLVSEREKAVLYSLADVAWTPLRSGTGSSLKVPEYVARGKVTIGTSVGLRGFRELERFPSVLCSEAPAKALAGVLEALQACPGHYDEACREASDYVRDHYSWEGTARHLTGFL